VVELTINNLIKIIIGLAVFVVVVLGVYMFFKEYILDFFKNQAGGVEAVKMFLSLI